MHAYANVHLCLECASYDSIQLIFLVASFRNPTHSARPTAGDILGVFCKSERVLLGWKAEDTVAPLSRTLGAPLIEGETLHRDLQNKYKGSLAKQ